MSAPTCPNCGNSDPARIGGSVVNDRVVSWWCEACSHVWPRRFPNPGPVEDQ